jgi:cell division protein FtsW
MARVQEQLAAAKRHTPDYGLLTATLVLLIVGLITVYSASYALAEAETGDPNFYAKRQAVMAGLGLLGLLVAMNINYHHLSRLSPLLMLAAIGLLVLVLLPGFGHEANGAQRWIQVGSLPPMQPSEFAKLAVIIYMAAWLASKGDAVRDWSLGVVPFVLMVGLVGALIVLEPDLGTAVMVAAITGTLFFLAGARLWHVLILAASGTGIASLLILLGGYRVDRILSFTSAEADPSGLGFQTLQLLVAFGSGGLTGVGLGVSRQKFFYLPGSHTDGVLAIVGEELGFIGTMLVLALFLVVLWRGWLIMKRADDQFGSLLAAGILAWIGFQMLLNVGGVTRIIPLTGIPLPLLSYGGSSLAITLTAIGVLLSVSRYTRDHAADAEAAEAAKPWSLRRAARATVRGGAR